MTEPAPLAPQRSRLGLFGMLALVGSALVGFNTLIVSCSADRAARDAAQLHRIEEQERFWTEAMRDLSDLLRSKDESLTDNWQRRCALLAARTAPFVETKKPEATRAADGEIEITPNLLPFAQRVYELQDAFATQIRDEKIVGPDCARLYAEKRDEVADASRTGERTVEGAGFETAGEFAEAIVARQDLIELAGGSERGWDIDVFWCERENQADSDRNFREALELGRKLAVFAESGDTLETYLLGRIRVRMLASSLQNLDAYRVNARSRRYIYDTRLDERGLGQAIGQLAGNLSGKEGGLATRWYVSAFYCGAGTPPLRDSTTGSASAAPAPAN